MKIYLATALPNVRNARVVAELLISQHHEITYPWFNHESFADWITRTHPAEAAQEEWLRVRALDDAWGVAAAEAVVCLWPMGHGSHTEMGMALGMSLAHSYRQYPERVSMTPAVVLWDPHEDMDQPYANLFMRYPTVKVVNGDLLELVAVVARLDADRTKARVARG